jgi:hypothetical protein
MNLYAFAIHLSSDGETFFRGRKTFCPSCAYNRLSVVVIINSGTQEKG